MITEIRKKIKSRLFQIILLIVLLSMVLPASLGELYRWVTSGSAWVVSVNGDKIFTQDLTIKAQEIALKIKQISQQNPDIAEIYLNMMGLNRDPRDLAMETLVEQMLLNQAANTLGLPVSSQAVTDLFATIDPQVLAEQLRMKNLTYDKFEAQVKQDMGRSMLESLAKSTVYAPQFAVKEAYKSGYLGKKFSIVPFKLSDFIAKESAQVTGDKTKIKMFFEEQNTKSKRYFVPEKRSGIIWKFDPSQYEIAISSKEIEHYYETYKSNFREKPVQLQVRRILLHVSDANESEVSKKAEQLQKELAQHPEQFAQKAKEFSQDLGSAKDGGLLPLFVQGTYDRIFERAAFALEKNGDVSPVIKTEKGLEIIQRVEKKQAVYKTLDAVQTEIKNKLTQQKFNAQFQSDVKMVLEKAAQDPKYLQEFVAQKKGLKQILSNVTFDQTPLRQSLFRLQPNGYTDFIEGDLGIILHLTGIDKSHMPAFEDVAAIVEKDYVADRAKSALQEAIVKAQAQAKGKTAQEFNTLFAGKIQSTPLVKPTDSQEIKKLQDQGIIKDDLLQLEKVGSLIVSQSGDNGFLIRLDAIEPFNENEFKKHEDQIATESIQRESQAVLNGFVASLYRNARIKQK